MNELTYFFIQGLIILLLIIFGLFLLIRIKRILAWLLAFWIILAILAFLVLPLVAIVLAIVYLGKK